MSFNLTGVPGTLTVANAASHAKGQETLKESSSDTREKNRIGRQIFLQEKTDQEKQKTMGAQKGMLA